MPRFRARQALTTRNGREATTRPYLSVTEERIMDIESVLTVVDGRIAMPRAHSTALRHVHLPGKGTSVEMTT